MCIAASVGMNATNRFEDVKATQILLNMNRARAGIPSEVAEDGTWGTHTQEAIITFQKVMPGVADPSGQVDPAGTTLQQLRAGIPKELSEAKLQATMPRARGEDVTKFFPPMASTLSAYSIDTPLR